MTPYSRFRARTFGQLGAAALVAASASLHAAPSAADVRLWAASCAACHGTHGRAEGAGLHLAGRPVKELYDALIAYKTGTKAATVMHQHAKGYTDEELRALADHFSKVK